MTQSSFGHLCAEYFIIVPGIRAFPFAGIGYLRAEILESTLRVLRILIGGKLPNILMFMFVYRVFRHKIFSNKLWILYLADFVCTFISVSMGLDYYQNHLGFGWVTVSELGGVTLWTTALLLMTLALFLSCQNIGLDRQGLFTPFGAGIVGWFFERLLFYLT